MKILVTGGTGFIGGRVVMRLLQRGLPVVAADSALNIEWLKQLASFHAMADGQSELPALIKGVAFEDLDISDFEGVDRLFDKHKGITHVIHLAFLFNNDILTDIRRGVHVNVVGSTNMFEAAAAHGVKRLVFSSSEVVYGPSQEHYGNHPVCEDEYCAPHEHFYLYARMKLLIEGIAAEFVKADRLDIVCTRPPVVFGDGRDRGAIQWVGQMASNPAVGHKVELPFSENSTESWIYVDDCAEQHVRLALKEGKLSHPVYNCGGESLSAKQIMGMVRQWVPDATYVCDESVMRTPLIDDTDGSRMQAEIGFTPRPVKQALKIHINEARFRAGMKLIE